MSKASRLLQIASKTFPKDPESAHQYAVMALKSEDAIDALDKLLPRVPEPEPLTDSEMDLTAEQVASIRSLASKVESRQKEKIATAILARLDKIESLKKKRK